MSCCGGLPPVPFLEDEDNDEDDWSRIYSKLNRDVKEEEPTTKKVDWQEYMFNGVQVSFPYVAYKSQKQLMSKTVEGVNKVQNCLLESPTGTGKTAALLCALLGWQEHCRLKNLTAKGLAKKANEAAGNCTCTCGLMPNPEKSEKLIGNPIIEAYSSSPHPKFRLCVTFMEDQEDDYPDGTVAMEEGDQGSPSKMMKREPKNIQTRQKDKDELCRYCLMTNFFKPTVPKIIYATRTHSQVQQVVDQLKGTPYRDVRMTILASRKMTCIKSEAIIHVKEYESMFIKSKNISKSSSQFHGVSAVVENQRPNASNIVDGENEDDPKTLDDICKQLRQNYFWNKIQKELEENGDSFDRKNKELELKPVCEFYKPDLSRKFRHLLLTGAFDIEELKSTGQQCTGCPYYGSQSLYEESNIVFCPYNYIISRGIRNTTGIDLTGNIIVFDEAHNLEDICRDESSMTVIDLNRLDGRVRWDLDFVLDKAGRGRLNKTPKIGAAEYFSMLLQRLSTWMRNTAPTFSERNIYASTPIDGPQHIVFKDTKMLEVFDELGFGEKDLDKNLEHLEALTDADKVVDKDDNSSSSTPQSGMSQIRIEPPEPEKFKVPPTVSRFITKLLRTVRYVYEDENYQHYNVVLVNNGEDLKPTAKESNSFRSSNIEKKHTVVPRRQYNVSLEIICLSPAIAFKAIRDQCHSVIVTSGTLSPLNSFAGELQTPFQVRLIADHVVGSHQTFSGCVKSGLSKKFELNKDGQKDVEIQDDLGTTILRICQTVPHGVLIFLPSYSFMDILKDRWSKISSPDQVMSMLKQLEFCKHVFFEERKDKDVFEKDMEKFKQLINNPVQNSSQTGCLLFAVFRGKVSEGINFTDDQARAVVTVGIPFSNFGSYTIKYKREYNDERIRILQNDSKSSSTDLLSGNDWYNIQAFRAMNQAFGRCIRHKNDWGAILMLDYRMCLRHNKDKLSNWVKAEMQVFGNFCEMKNRLHYFIQDRVTSVTPSKSSVTILDRKKLDLGDFDTSIESIDVDITSSDDESYVNHTRLTQVTNNLKLSKPNKNFNTLPAENSSHNKKKPSPVEDLDSSSYSLDESDCVDHVLYPTRNTNPPIISVHDLPTQVILQNISEDDISYHSPNNSASSNDIMEGTP